MNEKEFNLIKEPWIKISTNEGKEIKLNLMETLVDAHKYRGLSGEMSSQDVAILRFLVAIVHTVITRMDFQGNECLADDEETCIERWKTIWENRCFSEITIQKYLKQWEDRFWLFHPTRPFYQVPNAAVGTKNTVSKLNGSVSESNNKVRIFSQIAGVNKERMLYDESARWLFFINGFDDCAAKQVDKTNGSKGYTVGWLGKLGIIYAMGNNLFETLMLNTPMLTGKDMHLWEKDVPIWELDDVRSSEREIIEMPNNLASLYTLQSRRILLLRENDYVSGYCLMGGDAFEDVNALDEPMTLWRTVEDKKTKQILFRPLLHQRERYIWQNFITLAVPEKSAMRPGAVNWCDKLRQLHILSKKRLLTFGISCVRYDSSQSSSITDSFSDDVVFQSDLLSEAGKYWCMEIEKQIQKIEKAAYYVGLFVSDVRRAEGLDTKGDNVKIQEAKELLYHDIDLIFREWLLQIDAEQDNEERNDISIKLENKVRELTLDVGRRLMKETNDSAFVGRNIEIKKNVRKHYSSPEAFYWFKNNVWKLYPKMKGDEKSD